MSAHMVCVTSGGGLPIFSRKKGSTDVLPFSVVGSLNGVHMFGKPFNMELLNTITDDYVIAWKEFQDSVVLIGIASGCSIEVLNILLQVVFDVIVLIVGIDEIKSQRNVERIKRELRICYPVIDRLLDSLDCGDSSNKHSSDIAGCVETILSPDNHLLQVSVFDVKSSVKIALDSFAECVDSMYSCILLGGKIMVATDSWWSLHPHESRLLTLLAVTENAENSKDIPVFLPYKSPTVAFRFIACNLLPDIQVCCLCGATPELKDIEHFATQCFKSMTDIFKNTEQCIPRNFPAGMVIDASVLGLLLFNTKLRKYMMSKNTQSNSSRKQTSSSHRSDILRSFFYQSAMKFVLPKSENVVTSDINDKLSIDDQTEGKESYWCSEYHKCHALRDNDNILCILYGSATPNYTMRLITKKTLEILISDKQVCW